VPRALARIALDRWSLRRTPGLRFGRLLGTSTGFSARGADLRRWVLVASWERAADASAFEASAMCARWRRLAAEQWRVELRPLAVRGRWSKRAPFGQPAAAGWDGPVAALTRARLTARGAVAFWRAVPNVAADLADQDSALTAFGLGEAPVGWQGTFSVWPDAAALRAFAYEGPVHAAVIKRTADVGWYAEELFARFGVLASAGTMNGRDPLAMNPLS
jgi:hypothetical protein